MVRGHTKVGGGGKCSGSCAVGRCCVASGFRSGPISWSKSCCPGKPDGAAAVPVSPQKGAGRKRCDADDACIREREIPLRPGLRQRHDRMSHDGPSDLGRGASRVASVRVGYRYDATVARVFDAWLDPDSAGRWLFATASRPMTHVEIDARVGGAFCFTDGRNGIRHRGEYLRIDRYRRIAFTLSIERNPDLITDVAVAFAASTRGCALNLIHCGLPPDLADYMEGRWTGILYGLGTTLDCQIATFDHQQGASREIRMPCVPR